MSTPKNPRLKVVAVVSLTLALAAMVALADRYSETSVQRREQSAVPAEVTESPASPLVTELPDFAAVVDVRARKQQFFEFLHSHIVAENAAIADDRQRLLALQQRIERGEGVDDDGRQLLQHLASHYGLEAAQGEGEASAGSEETAETQGTEGAEATEATQNTEQKLLMELLKRVDGVPASLVLAQAANESAWGTSRFAREGLALFGQWCFRAGCGMVPAQRPRGAVYEMRRFRDVAAAVRAYLLNINTHNAYRNLRDIRAWMRQQGQSLDSIHLADGLSVYSERGDDYINEIRSIIRQNGLKGKYDG